MKKAKKKVGKNSKLAKLSKKRAPKKAPKRQMMRPEVPASAVNPAVPGLESFVALGAELTARLHAVAERREVSFDEVLQEAVQKYLESEIVEPTTEAKDEALYPETAAPLEEAPIVRSEADTHAAETAAIDLTEN